MTDLQLVEAAERNCPREFLFGLGSCIFLMGQKWMGKEQYADCLEMNGDAKKLFQTETYKIFLEDTLPNLALEYTAGDVEYMFELYDRLYPLLTQEKRDVVVKAPIIDL